MEVTVQKIQNRFEKRIFDLKSDVNDHFSTYKLIRIIYDDKLQLISITFYM